MKKRSKFQALIERSGLRWIGLILGFAAMLPVQAFAIDCNQNGVEDATDISSATSVDCNSNSIPDECDVSARSFVPGAVNEFDVEQVTNSIGLVSLLPTGVADFNHDGKQDLYGINSTFSVFGPITYISITLNQGSNTFAAPVKFTYSGTAGFSYLSVTGLTAEDVDNDGDIDLIFRQDDVHWRGFSSATYSVDVLVNDGAGNFTQQSTNIAALIPSRNMNGTFSRLVPAHLATATSNDFMMIHEGRIYALYHTTGLNYVSFDMGAANNATDIVTGKFVGPSQEIFAYNTNLLTGRILAPGDGSLQRSDEFIPNYVAGSHIIAAELQTGRSSVESELISLLPGGDIIQPHPGTTSIAVTGNSLVDYPATEYTAARVYGLNEVPQPVDFDGDGDKDLPLLGATSAEVLLNNGSGHFTQRLHIFYPATLKRALAVGDFNADGKLDLLFESATSGKAALMLNASTLPYTNADSSDADASGVPDQCERAAAGDFTGDKKSDVTVVRNVGGQFFWFTHPSTPFPEDPQGLNPTPRILGSTGDTLLAGDFDGDGKVSPGIVATVGNGLHWASINGDNTTAEVDFGLAGDTPLTGYLDTDRKLDRIVVRQSGAALTWYYHLSSSTPGTVSAINFGLAGDRPFAADLNGDGRDEIIVARTEASGLVNWYAYSLATNEALTTISWGLAGDKLLPPSDFDGDGKADMAVTRVLGGFLQTFVRPTASLNNGVTFQLLFGLPGDELYLSHTTRQPIAEISIRRPLASVLGSFYNRVGQGTTETLLGFFGLSSDTLIGSDGRAVQRYGNVGSLTCSISFSSDGPGGYLWQPNGAKRPRYFVPAGAGSLVKGVDIYSTAGVVLDGMSQKRKGSSEFTAKKRTVPQLVARTADGALVVQTRFKNGNAVCQIVDYPNFADD